MNVSILPNKAMNSHGFRMKVTIFILTPALTNEKRHKKEKELGFDHSHSEPHRFVDIEQIYLVFDAFQILISFIQVELNSTTQIRQDKVKNKNKHNFITHKIL